MIQSHAERSLLALLLLFAVSCSDGTSPAGAGELQQSPPDLPTVLGGICESEPSYPNPCEWASSMDAIAWVQIEEVRFSDVFTSDSCDSGVPAIDLDISVTKVLAGDLPSSFSATIGGGIAKGWATYPDKDGDAPVVWRGMEHVEDPPNHTEAPALVEGQVIGIALHFDEESGRWTTLGERLFQTRENADARSTTVQFQPGECANGRVAPEEFEGMEIGQFEDLVRACEPNAASSAREERIESDYDKPSYTFAGWCWRG